MNHNKIVVMILLFFLFFIIPAQAASYKTIVLSAPTTNTSGTIIEINNTNYIIPQSQWDEMSHNGSDTRFTNIYGNVTYPHYRISNTGRTNFGYRVNVTQTGQDAIRWTYGNSSLSDSALNIAETTIFSDNFSTNTLGSTWLGDTGNFNYSNNRLTMSTGAEARKSVYHQIDAGVGTPINITIKINETASTNFHEGYVGIADGHGSSIQATGNGVSVGSANYATYLWAWIKTTAGVGTNINHAEAPDYVQHTHNLRYDGSSWTYYLDGVLKGTQAKSDFNETYVMLGDYSSVATKMFWDDLTINTSVTVPSVDTVIGIESGSWVKVAPKNTSLSITDLIRNITVLSNNEVYFGAGDVTGNDGRLLHWNQTSGTLEDVGGGLLGDWAHWQVLDPNGILYIVTNQNSAGDSGKILKWNSNNNTVTTIVPDYAGGVGWYSGLWFNNTIYAAGTGNAGATRGIIGKWNQNNNTWSQVAPQYGGVYIPGVNLITWRGHLYGGSDRSSGRILMLNETSGLLEAKNNQYDATGTAFHWIIAYNATEMSEGTDTGDLYAGTNEPTASASHGYLLKYNSTSNNMELVAGQFTGDGGAMTAVNTIWMMGGELYATLRNVAPTREVTVRWNGADAWIQAAPHVPEELTAGTQLYSTAYWNGTALSGSTGTGNLYKFITRRVLNPQNIGISISGANANISWQKGLNVDEYSVYRNGTLIANTTNLYYNMSVPTAGTHTLSVIGHNSTYDSYTETLSTTGTTTQSGSSNSNAFIFASKTISELQITQSSQATVISVNITDPDGYITAATVGITLNGTETNYTMVNTSSIWSYSFISGVPGAYTVSNFYATDNATATNNSVWSQAFQVVPVSAGGGIPPANPTPATTPTNTTGGSSGGGAGGTGSVPQESFAETIAKINIKTIAKDPTGELIFIIILCLGLLMAILGAASKKVARSTMFWGLIMVIFSGYALGVIN